MLAEYRRQRDTALSLIVLASVAGVLIGILFESEWASVVWQACGAGAMLLLFVVYYYYAKAKGYHGVWGLPGFLGPFRWIILMCFPDKQKQ